MPEPGAELPPPAEIAPRESASAVAILLFDLIAAVANFLSFAVLFSLLCLAFRRCTGWVPAASGNLPARAHPDDSDRSDRSEEHTSELQSLMRISYAVFCLKKNTQNKN